MLVLKGVVSRKAPSECDRPADRRGRVCRQGRHLSQKVPGWSYVLQIIIVVQATRSLKFGLGRFLVILPRHLLGVVLAAVIALPQLDFAESGGMACLSILSGQQRSHLSDFLRLPRVLAPHLGHEYRIDPWFVRQRRSGVRPHPGREFLRIRGSHVRFVLHRRCLGGFLLRRRDHHVAGRRIRRQERRHFRHEPWKDAAVAWRCSAAACTGCFNWNSRRHSPHFFRAAWCSFRCWLPRRPDSSTTFRAPALAKKLVRRRRGEPSPMSRRASKCQGVPN